MVSIIVGWGLPSVGVLPHGCTRVSLLLAHAFSFWTVVQSYNLGVLRIGSCWLITILEVPLLQYVGKAAPDAVISLAVAGRRLNLFVMFYIFVFL